jgi:hypothetical protein
VALARPVRWHDRVTMRDRPWFLWGVEITDAEFRERLKHPDPGIRAQWQGRLLRWAKFGEIGSFVTLPEVLENWERIRPHLGGQRAFWDWLIEGWRKDGLLPAA